MKLPDWLTRSREAALCAQEVESLQALMLQRDARHARDTQRIAQLEEVIASLTHSAETQEASVSDMAMVDDVFTRWRANVAVYEREAGQFARNEHYDLALKRGEQARAIEWVLDDLASALKAALHDTRPAEMQQTEWNQTTINQQRGMLTCLRREAEEREERIAELTAQLEAAQSLPVQRAAACHHCITPHVHEHRDSGDEHRARHRPLTHEELRVAREATDAGGCDGDDE